MKQLSLDSQITSGAIQLGRGNIISSKDIAAKPGDYPIYSSSAQGKGEFGRYADFMFDEELITWSVDGGGRFFFRSKHKFSVTNVCGYMRVDDNIWNRRFVYYTLDLQHANMAFDYQMKAHPSVIRKIYTFGEVPKPEQTKIAEILSTVDRAIEQTEALIAKQQRLKTGLMQDLLTRGIDEHGNLRSEQTHKFKDSPLGRIPVEWEVKRLGILLNSMNQGWSPDCESDPAAQGEWGVLRTTAVVWEGYQDHENKGLPPMMAPRPHLEIHAGDLLMTRAGPNSRVGVLAYVYGTRSKLILSDKIYRLVPTKEADGRFLCYALSSSGSQRHLSNLKTGMAESQTNISQEIVKALMTVCPPSAEQSLIADRLDHISSESNKSTTVLAKLRSLKTALMQDLLTGRKRVTEFLDGKETSA